MLHQSYALTVCLLKNIAHILTIPCELSLLASQNPMCLFNMLTQLVRSMLRTCLPSIHVNWKTVRQFITTRFVLIVLYSKSNFHFKVYTAVK